MSIVWKPAEKSGPLLLLIMFQLVSYRGIQKGWIACGKARPWDEALLLMRKAQRINGDRWSYSLHSASPELPSFI